MNAATPAFRRLRAASRRFLTGTKGSAAVEVAVIAGLLGAALVAGFGTLASQYGTAATGF